MLNGLVKRALYAACIGKRNWKQSTWTVQQKEGFMGCYQLTQSIWVQMHGSV